MDTLARTKKLEALGFDRPRAEGLVQMVKESIDEEVAKKIDLRELRTDLKSDVSEVRLEIGQVKSELKLDISDLRGEMKDEFGKVQIQFGEVQKQFGEVQKQIGGVQSELGGLRGESIALSERINSVSSNLKIWLGGLMISLFALGVEYKPETNLLQQIISKLSEEKVPVSEVVKSHATP